MVKFDLEVTFKPTGERTQMSKVEICTVVGGKLG